MTNLPPSHADRPRRRLETVTLCAVSSSNMEATVLAMKASLAQIKFAEALLFTDRDAGSLGLDESSEIRVVPIRPIRSSEAYSHFMLNDLAAHIATDYALIVQWDGHVIDAGRWQDGFLDYDYIGASWPQFDDGHDVGNGGFSLRSRRLMEACRQPGFERHHPEDLAIGRTNRTFLENLGLRFAPAEIANQFSAERASDPARTFGYHGVFLMPQVLGVEGFWAISQNLSDRTTLWIDYRDMIKQVFEGRGGFKRALILACQRCADWLKAT